MAELDKLQNEVLSIIKEESKDLWKKEEDTEFLKNISLDIAAQQIKVRTAVSDEKRAEYLANIAHLQTQLQGRIASKKNDLINTGDWILTKVVNVALKMAISTIVI